MADMQNFRKALNGFNREDVVRYIEYINAKHAEEMNQLRSEIEFLQEKLNAPTQEPELEEETEVCAAEPDDATAERVQELEAEVQDLRNQLAAALEAKAAVEASRNMSAVQFRMEQELEAYRRAERTERMARERAEQVYRTANGVLADATVRVDEAASKISEMSDQVMFQLNLLESAVSGSKQALKDAAATMYAIRPGNEE